MKKKKNRVGFILLGLVAVLALLIAGWWFHSEEVDKSYKIEGVSSAERNGTVVCMYDYFSEEKINEATIAGGAFVLEGEVDTAYLARLVNEDVTFDLVVEPGEEIEVNIEEGVFIKSTDLNNELAQFQAMVKDYNLMVLADSTGVYREAFQADVVTSMENHLNDMLGVYMLKEYLKLNPTVDELDNLVCNFGTVVSDNPTIANILQEHFEKINQ